MIQEIKAKEVVLTNLFDPVWIGNLVFGIGVLFFIFLIAAAIWISRNTSEDKKNVAIALGAIFALAPPTYFFFEIILFREYGIHSQWDQFKHLQSTAAKFWAAGLAVLYAVYSKSFPK